MNLITEYLETYNGIWEAKKRVLLTELISQKIKKYFNTFKNVRILKKVLPILLHENRNKNPTLNINYGYSFTLLEYFNKSLFSNVNNILT